MADLDPKCRDADNPDDSDATRQRAGQAAPEDSKIDGVGSALTIAESLNAQAVRSLLRNRNFVPLWFGQFTSYMGDQFMLIAIIAVINKLGSSIPFNLHRLDGSQLFALFDPQRSSSLALVLFAISLAAPQLLFGLIGGVLSDRLDRKWTMVLCDATSGMVTLVMILGAERPEFFWIIYPSIFVRGTTQMLFFPARASAIPAVVPKRELAAANGLLEAGFVVALIFGSGAAGVLVEHLGAGVAFALNGFTFLFSASMLLTIRIPRRKTPLHASASYGDVWRDLREGLVYVWTTRSMRFIMGLSTMVAGGLGAVIILIFDYLTLELNIGAGGFGIVIAILGVGIVIGGVVIQRLSKFLPTNRLVALAILLQSVAVSSFILHPSFAVVLLMTALIGFSLIVARAVLSTLTQAIPPEEYRGRVQSTFNLIFTVPLTVALGIATLLISFLPREVVVAGFGILLLLTAWFAANMLRGVDEAIFGS